VTIHEVAEHLARRLHTLKLHREPFERCSDWECAQAREVLGKAEERAA
jgi:hypothetical protein